MVCASSVDFPWASGFFFSFFLSSLLLFCVFLFFFLLFVDKEVYQFVPFLPNLKRLRAIRDGKKREILLSERFCQLVEMSRLQNCAKKKKRKNPTKLFRQNEKKKLGGTVSQIGMAGQR